MDSIKDLEVRLRIYLFPTTLLLDPDGKVISLNQNKKDQPSLRGRELITSLDRLLPPLARSKRNQGRGRELNTA
jgi:hypothetical protein